MRAFIARPLELIDYHEYAVGSGSGVAAVCYLELKIDDNISGFSVAQDSNIMIAAIKALISGINRLTAKAIPTD